jgi:Ca2+-binding EF-hand superfamily protein
LPGWFDFDIEENIVSSSAVLERLGQRFAKWDVNGDGVIDRPDFEAEARRILRAFNEKENTPKGLQVIAGFTGMFEYLAEKAGQGSHGRLTPEQFATVAVQEVIDRGDAGFATVVRPAIQAVLSLADTDGDGQISPSEFRTWMKAIGVSESDAAESFKTIDVNGDGHLSIDELIIAVKQYHNGELDVPLLGH